MYTTFSNCFSLASVKNSYLLRHCNDRSTACAAADVCFHCNKKAASWVSVNLALAVGESLFFKA